MKAVSSLCQVAETNYFPIVTKLCDLLSSSYVQKSGQSGGYNMQKDAVTPDYCPLKKLSDEASIFKPIYDTIERTKNTIFKTALV